MEEQQKATHKQVLRGAGPGPRGPGACGASVSGCGEAAAKQSAGEGTRQGNGWTVVKDECCVKRGRSCGEGVIVW